MANFLQSSSTAVLTTTNRISPIFPKTNFSAKPSHLLPNARRSRRFHVSCSGGVDRRNMLLGLGGLYGAANLMSDPKAYANPIQPPDLKECGPVRDTKTGDLFNVDACPPPSDTVLDFQFPTVREPRVRPPAHALPDGYLAKYEEAVLRMKALDKTDPTDPRGFTQQANIHCAYCNGAYIQTYIHEEEGKKKKEYSGTNISVHSSWLFFPFHRWYLYFYERILGKLIGDPTFALPFWNYDSRDGMQLPAIFDNPASPLYDVNRNLLHRRPATLDLSLNSGITDEAQLKENNLNAMYSEMIGSVNSTEDFMGKPYKFGDLPPKFGSGGTVERGSHTGIHVWVGNPVNKYKEDLGNFYSAARDPVFFSLHSNVDRLWTLWQSLPANFPKNINASDYSDAAFLFYNEEKELVKVKARECFDNIQLGYKYQDVHIPWKYYRPSTNSNLPKEVELKEKTDLFPLTVDKIRRVVVTRKKDKASNEVLVLHKVESDREKFVKFDVFINGYPDKTDNVVYAGTYAHLGEKKDECNHKVEENKEYDDDLKISLKKVLENLKIDGVNDKLVVSLIPRSDDYAKITDIKIIVPDSPN